MFKNESFNFHWNQSPCLVKPIKSYCHETFWQHYCLQKLEIAMIDIDKHMCYNVRIC